MDYLQEDSTKCPFCQKQTITDNLRQEIKNYFGESYQNKITKLKRLNSEYQNSYQEVENNKSELLKNNPIKDREGELNLYYKSFTDKLSSNLSKINKKINNPSKAIELETTTLEKDALNNFFDEIIQEIITHNLKIENKVKTKKEIVNNFWKIMRWDYDQTVKNYNNQKEEIKKGELDIKTKISALNKNIKKQKDIIKDAQKEMVNIQDAIDAINSELKFFGLDGFSIIPEGKESYKLKRPNDDIAKFETLSEGEKTVISFLYFLELCKGKETSDEVVTEKIVVIDDPISSLSHIYVFNVAQLIRKDFFNDECKQVFIFTHNLYFFHEILYKQKEKNYKLFRICRSEFSQILEMDRKDIQNEYQSYWQILNDYEQGMTTEVLLANTMRNILEIFFGFIEKNDFNELTKNLKKEEKNKFFIRFINKESHSDPINISDTKEIDPQIFKKAFKKIFENSGYIEHYNKMINQ